MLWVVLALVLLSFGLLVVALVTTNTGWAWGSVGASGMAAGLLVADWFGRRRVPPDAAGPDRPDAPHEHHEATENTRSTQSTDSTDDTAGVGAATPSGRTDAEPYHPADERPADDEPASGRSVDDQPDRPPVEVATDDPVEPESELDRAPSLPLDPEVEPAEEGTDVADVIAVSELDDEVVVIDERPRYHLTGCRWVGDREVIALPVAEARELGFTPCAVCRPDFTIAARRRTASR